MVETKTRKKLPLPGMSSLSPGSEYDDEKNEFITAILAWRQKNQRFPLWSEALDILRELGWRKGDTDWFG